MKTEKEEQNYKNEMIKLKKFLLLVNTYMNEFYSGLTIPEMIEKLDDQIIIYEYNKELDVEDLKLLCNFIKEDEDIKENKYALSYAASRYFNTYQTGNKQIDEYIFRMHQSVIK